MLRMASLTDFHYMYTQGNKKGHEAPALLDAGVKNAVDHNVDLITSLGDEVNFGLPPDEAARLRAQCRSHFDQAAHIPQIKIPGNHDVVYEALEDSSSIDMKGLHIVAFRTPMELTPNGIVVPREHLDWLERDLMSTTLPSIVLNHIGFSNFGRHPIAIQSHHFPHYYNNEGDVHDIFNRAGNVILSLSGHRHMDETITATHNNRVTYHITQQSLIRSTPDDNRACGATSFYEISDRQIGVRHFGRGRPANADLAL